MPGVLATQETESGGLCEGLELDVQLSAITLARSSFTKEKEKKKKERTHQDIVRYFSNYNQGPHSCQGRK